MRLVWMGLVAGCVVVEKSEESSEIGTETTEAEDPPPVDDGIDISGTWSGPCEQSSSTDTGAWPLESDWTFDLVDTYGELTGTTGAAWIHGQRTGHHVTFHLAFDESTTGSLEEEYFDLELDEGSTSMTGVLASYVTAPTYTCTFARLDDPPAR